jgi:hypothetical protein
MHLDSLYTANAGAVSWLKSLFGRKNRKKLRLKDQYLEKQIIKQIKVLENKKQQEIDKYNSEIKAWQDRLNELYSNNEG